MKNHARNTLIALLTLMFILSITRFARAAGPSINLPPGTVSAKFDYPGSNSYWTITLSYVPLGYDVTNEAYTGWCNDESHFISSGETLDGVTLYSSYAQTVYPGDWNRVNYIINHPQGLWTDVQDAIWYYIDGHAMPSSAAGKAMVNDATAYGGGFEPAPGQLLAVVVWKETYQTTFIAVVVPAQLTVNNGGHGTASGQGSYPAGSSATFGITPTTVSGGTGVQYIFTGWSSSDTGGYTGPLSTNSVIMNNNITETANWQTQYQLTVNSAYGTALGAGWYNDGTTGVPFSVSPTTVSGGTGIQYVFTGWTSSDTGGYTGSASSSTVTMSNPITETATWQTQYLLTVTSPYDTPGGGGWYPSGSTAYATLSSGGPISGGTGIRYVFTSWSGDASGTGLTSAGIIMSGPKTATAVWTTQYYLTVLTSPSGLTPTIPGAGWYDGGSAVPLTAPPTLESPSTRTFGNFLYWDVDGTSQGIGVNSITVHMSPHTATAHYTTPAVGGEWAPITMQALSPIGTLQLMAPWIALGLFAAASAIAASRRLFKKRW
ncbi:MAG: hypothetical protein ABSD73_08990 [Candidatus Bathyarchaeia archaeon]